MLKYNLIGDSPVAWIAVASENDLPIHILPPFFYAILFSALLVEEIVNFLFSLSR
jgi:hypothetical protein